MVDASGRLLAFSARDVCEVFNLRRVVLLVEMNSTETRLVRTRGDSVGGPSV
jgi:hypothetical protein